MLFCSSPLITCPCLQTSSGWLLSSPWAFPAISTFHNLDFLSDSLPSISCTSGSLPHTSHLVLILPFPILLSTKTLQASFHSCFLILRLQCSFSLRVPCTAKKRADTLIPWTLTRPVSSYLFFPVLLVFRPVPLLFASQASGAFFLPPRLLCSPQPTAKTSLHLSNSKANPACSHSSCSNSCPRQGSSPCSN